MVSGHKTIFIVTKSDTSGLDKLDVANKRSNRSMREAELQSKKTEKAFNSWAAGVSTGVSSIMGSLTTMGLLGGVSAGLMAGVPLMVGKMGASLSEAIHDIAAMAHSSEAEIKKLYDAANDAAIEFGYTQESVANGMYYMVSSGREVEEVLRDLNDVLTFAKIANTDLENAIQAVVVAQDTFKDETLSVLDISDKIGTSVKKTMGTAEDILEFMQNASSSIKTLGVSFNESLSLFAAVSEVMGPRKAGTSMRNFLVKFAQNLDEFGETIVDTEGRLLPLTEIMEILARQFELGGKNAESIGELFSIIGIRGSRALINAIADMEQYMDVLDDLADTSGETATQLGYQMDSLETIYATLSAVLTAPLKTYEVQKEISDAVRDLVNTLDSSDYATKLGGLIRLMTSFLTDNAGKFIDMLIGMMSMFENLMPMIQGMGQMFMSIASLLSNEVVMGFLRVYLQIKLLLKVTPLLIAQFITLIKTEKMMIVVTKYLSWVTKELLAGLQGILMGLFFMYAMRNDLFGFIIGAASLFMGLVVVLKALNFELKQAVILSAALSGGATLAFLALGIGATETMMSGMGTATYEGAGGTTGGGTTTNITNVTNNNTLYGSANVDEVYESINTSGGTI